MHFTRTERGFLKGGLAANRFSCLSASAGVFRLLFCIGYSIRDADERRCLRSAPAILAVLCRPAHLVALAPALAAYGSGLFLSAPAQMRQTHLPLCPG